MKTIENRQAARFDIDVAAEIYTSKEILSAVAANLSSSGVRLELSQALEEGKTLGVSLFLTSDGIEDPDAEPLNVKARIVWSAQSGENKFSAGASFVDMNEKSQKLLGSFLSTLGLK